ncbi:hypothetical protein OJF2_67640 [Aquisphaera giovannonii]|uniref:Prepilin-type N-terminal cleavage/methylation domain-containing protein n=1 Tax=Aquisphaera giovannonii TaxID=406548 RepID=A0A5B9WC28_9BACT|nr:hypothetical protein [Aquisphaera giovannonii]QEH38166.1 hypothetical protein OJF2_67640 [Aquisphaera giovannonii]
MKIRTTAGRAAPKGRAGITLTEILIAIMILGIGLISLATLFPIGLLRLREAQRQTRSSLLFESAACDVAARTLFDRNSFLYVDLVNNNYGWPFWYISGGARFDPLVHDTPYYGGAPTGDGAGNGASSTSYGLPFAYDPLWRQITVHPVTGTPGIYLDPVNQDTAEFRFADGTGLLPNDPGGGIPSAHGLQRLTNFNRPGFAGTGPSAFVPSIFVSPEDVVWQDSTINTYNVAFNPTVGVGPSPSSVVPDLSMTYDAAGNQTYQPVNDFRFSWMLTAHQANGSAGAAFDGNVVIFENRIFGTEPAPAPANFRAAGEFVCEGVFGASKNVQLAANAATIGSYGYGMGADRTVLIRWSNTLADPVVKVGDWIADVTYERNQLVVAKRFLFNSGVGAARASTLEWDNMPAQRCYWYQVQKVTPAQDDTTKAGFRSMTVYTNRKLEARTVLNTAGNPLYQNAVLICPQVVNVIPQTFFLR